MDRRFFLERVIQLSAVSAAGLIVPEWLLDPSKGQSMVSVPDLGENIIRFNNNCWVYYGKHPPPSWGEFKEFTYGSHKVTTFVSCHKVTAFVSSEGMT